MTSFGWCISFCIFTRRNFAFTYMQPWCIHYDMKPSHQTVSVTLCRETPKELKCRTSDIVSRVVHHQHEPVTWMIERVLATLSSPFWVDILHMSMKLWTCSLTSKSELQNWIWMFQTLSHRLSKAVGPFIGMSKLRENNSQQNSVGIIVHHPRLPLTFGDFVVASVQTLDIWRFGAFQKN